MSVTFVVTDGGVEYTIPFHPSDEMVCGIFHIIRGKAGALTATECYATYISPCKWSSINSCEGTTIKQRVNLLPQTFFLL